MRLHRKLVRTSKASGKKFYRYDVALPSRALEDLGWTPKTPLEAEVRGEELVIRRKKSAR